ncbi:MAG TPA: mechanosensitive ion channel domain-containing protein [Gemmataceae bacterium]|nr:mechanosensitive ion channel domain-containing protein [Gemmataceae bacterium]
MPEWWQQNRATVELYAAEGLRVLLILALGWLALRFLVAPLRRLLDRGRVDPTVASFLVSSARAVILIAVLVVVLQILGVPAATLLTVLGAAGLAIALSLQNSLANFAAGLLVLAFRVVRLDDLVEVGEFKGRVAEMQAFHVVLVTADNQRITVPNTLLMAGGVRNNTSLPSRRAQWTLALPGGEDLAAARQALRARVQADPRVLPEPPPQVFVQEWAPDKRVVAVQAWTATADYPAVQQDLLEPLGQTLDGLRPPAAGPGQPG